MLSASKVVQGKPVNANKELADVSTSEVEGNIKDVRGIEDLCPDFLII